MIEAELEIWQPPPSPSTCASSFPSLSPTSLTSLLSCQCSQILSMFFVLGGFVAPFFEWIFPAGLKICLPIRQRPQARPFNIGLALLDPHVLPNKNCRPPETHNVLTNTFLGQISRSVYKFIWGGWLGSVTVVYTPLVCACCAELFFLKQINIGLAILDPPSFPIWKIELPYQHFSGQISSSIY